jgi:hypothetical protein
MVSSEQINVVTSLRITFNLSILISSIDARRKCKYNHDNRLIINRRVLISIGFRVIDKSEKMNEIKVKTKNKL